MFPRRMMLCLEKEDHFLRCRSTISRLASELDSELVIFHARPVPDPSRAVSEPAGRSAAPLEFVWQDEDADGFAIETRVVETDSTIPEAILSMADSMDIDLIVLPTHGRRGLDRWLRGSITESVVRSCRCPVLVLDLGRPDGGSGFDRVVAPTDLSEVSKATLEVAAEWASRLGVGMTVLHAVRPPAPWLGGTPLATAAASWGPDSTVAFARKVGVLAKQLQRDELDVVSRIEVGGVKDLICSYASAFRNPLIVVSTTGRDCMEDHVIGSHAERIVRTARSPVLVLPEEVVVNEPLMA